MLDEVIECIPNSGPQLCTHTLTNKASKVILALLSSELILDYLAAVAILHSFCLSIPTTNTTSLSLLRNICLLMLTRL